MRRLVFIDDDQTEFAGLAEIVGSDYDYTRVHWPHESGKHFSPIPSPDIFVSDLYLPSASGYTSPMTAQKDAPARATKRVAELFLKVYADRSCDDKTRSRKTMHAIAGAYEIRKLQWSAFGQSPDHGIALLIKLKGQYPEVPLVFYSRKVTPEDVIRVLCAGVVDVIRKGALQKEEDVLVRPAAAQGLLHTQDIRIIRDSGFNVNVTAISGG